MRVIIAMVRATWRAAASYRMGTFFSLLGLALTVVPLFLVANALQSTMQDKIRGEGEQYFAFVLLGMIAITIVQSATSALPSTVGPAASGGTLDALFLTPTSPAVIFAGLASYGLLWTLLRCAILLVGGVILGAGMAWSSLPAALVVLLLLIAAHIPFGLMLTAMQVAFRTQGPFLAGFLTASTFLGGVYYPVSVIPSWIRLLSFGVPITYGLRAVRKLLLEGASITTVWPEISALLLFTAVFGALGLWCISAALKYARRTGRLSDI